jgi:hypothetical protein
MRLQAAEAVDTNQEGSVRPADDLARQLTKVLDAVELAHQHFDYEARMNAALHMNSNVRPAPLAVAITAARDDLARLIGELEEEVQ